MNAINTLHQFTKVPSPDSLQNILIVDDEQRFRFAYSNLLAHEQRSIEEASTGQEAIAKLRDGLIDLVILDMKLPDISGVEIMEWLATEEIDTLVIVFSADRSINAAIHALRYRAFEFLRKDCDPDEMVLAVERALSERQRKKEHAIINTRLKHSERLHRFLVEQSPDLIFTLSQDGLFTFINARVHSLLGFLPEELIGKHYTYIVDPRDHLHAQFAFSERRIGSRGTSNQEVRFRCKPSTLITSGNLVITAILSSQGIYEPSSKSQDGLFPGTSGVARDISERKKAEETITFQAFHDLLTQLPNRTLFVDRLELAIVQAKRRKERLAVMFFDLDRFKLVNDTYGHQVGDQLLCEFATRVRKCLRSGDTLARQGGDEFTALLPSLLKNDSINSIAEKILIELRKPFLIAGIQFLVTTSIGIAIFPDDATNAEELIRCADMAMYQIKGQGKNGYSLFEPHMETAHLDRLSIEHDLRHALETGDQFELYFQSQIDPLAENIIGLEALIRWHHPREGMVSPDVFIPIAEESALIIALSDWVLQSACAKLALLRNMGFRELRLGINLSPHEFDRSDLLERIQTPLEMFDIPPQSLEIEITESLLMRDVECIATRIQCLRNIGIHISIDDFGTRYSSLNYLRRFSVNRIKIDQAFVRDLGASQDSYAIIRAIVDIAKNFNLSVIAEGVETENQVARLLQLGCSEMQGYFFSRPLPFEELVAFLTH